MTSNTKATLTSRLICAKMNYCVQNLNINYINYNPDKNEFKINEMANILNDPLIYNVNRKMCGLINIYNHNIQTMYIFIKYVWDNIFDNIITYCGSNTLLLKIGTYNYFVSEWKYGPILPFHPLEYLLLGKTFYRSNEYIIKKFDEYDRLSIFRIWYLIILIEDELMNMDIMKIILHKMFFDPIIPYGRI